MSGTLGRGLPRSRLGEQFVRDTRDAIGQLQRGTLQLDPDGGFLLGAARLVILEDETSDAVGVYVENAKTGNRVLLAWVS